MAFGSIPAVWAWVGTTFLVKFCLLRVMMLLVSIYVDDLISPELYEPHVQVWVNDGAGGRAVEFHELTELCIDTIIDGLGFRKSPEKTDSTSETKPAIELLGAVYSFGANYFEADAKPGQKIKMRQAALDAAQRTPAQCTNLTESFKRRLQRVAGQVHFLLTVVKFSLLRALLCPLHAAVGDNPPQREILRQALFQLAETVPDAPPQRFDYDALQAEDEVVIFQDAADVFDGDTDPRPAIGAVAVVSTKRRGAVQKKVYFYQFVVPQNAVDAVSSVRKNGINYYELAAVQASLSTFRPLLQGRARVRFMIDNTAALYAANRGASKCPILRRMAQQLHRELIKSGITASCRYVPSAWNVSDGLTRKCLRTDFDAAVAPYESEELPPRVEAVFDLQLYARAEAELQTSVREARAAKRARQD